MPNKNPQKENKVDKENKVRNKKGQFVQGHPDVGGGRPKGSFSIIGEVKRQMLEMNEKTKRQFIEDIARNIVAEMMKGNNTMRKEIIRQIEGKPVQKHEMSGEITLLTKLSDAADSDE